MLREDTKRSFQTNKRRKREVVVKKRVRTLSPLTFIPYAFCHNSPPITGYGGGGESAASETWGPVFGDMEHYARRVGALSADVLDWDEIKCGFFGFSEFSSCRTFHSFELWLMFAVCSILSNMYHAKSYGIHLDARIGRNDRSHNASRSAPPLLVANSTQRRGTALSTMSRGTSHGIDGYSKRSESCSSLLLLCEIRDTSMPKVRLPHIWNNYTPPGYTLYTGIVGA